MKIKMIKNLFSLLTFHPRRTGGVTLRMCGFLLTEKNLPLLLVSEPWGMWLKESRTSSPELSPIVSVTPVYVIGTSKKESRKSVNNKRCFLVFDTKKTNLDNYSEIQTKLLSRAFQLEKKKVLHSIHEL